MKYFKRNWNETRDEIYDDFGKSIWYFEVDNDGNVLRQIEFYENGKILKYDMMNLQDEFGGLADQKLDLNEFSQHMISKIEFETKWNHKNLSMKTVYLFFTFLLIFTSCKNVPDYAVSQRANTKTFPKPIGYVNDYTSLFSEEETHSLRTIIEDYEYNTKREIVIVAVDSIQPYEEILTYATDLGNYWAVGKKEKDNGLMIVICPKIGQIGVATGLETEKILTTEICSNVIDSLMVPKFKQEKFYEGTRSGIEAFIRIWN